MESQIESCFWIPRVNNASVVSEMDAELRKANQGRAPTSDSQKWSSDSISALS